jgi:tetratricopeptide (TPR) repeat protein
MRRSLVALSLLLAMAPQLARADALSDGIGWLEKGDYERAVTALQQAAEAQPADPRPYQYLEKAYEALFRPTEAIAAHEQWLALREKAAKPKPTPKPALDWDPLPPVYVRPGPRPRLPAITNEMIPRQPTEYKATPIESAKPAAKAANPSDAETKADVAPPALPSPSATPTPPPNLDPLLEPTGYNAPAPAEIPAN